jgi:hypothetical protein
VCSAKHLVLAHAQRALDLVTNGLVGGVLSAAPVIDSLVLSRVDLEESGVSFSEALVWKSLRAASDILMIVWWLDLVV